MASKAKGKDIDAFRAAHDRSYIVPKRIREALADLGDSWEYEVDFIKRCQLDNTSFAAYRDQFKDFYVETGGKRSKRAWAGTKAFATKLRERVI
jgi:hypothetical protein